MSVWLVRLVGHAFDLDPLVTQVRSETYRVRKEKSDEYYLQSNRFDLLTDPRAVRQHGEELIQRLNGIAKLQSPSARPISFGGDVMRVEDDGTRTISVFPPPISIRSAAVISVVDGSGVRQPTTTEMWMAQAEQDSTVARAVRLFGQEHSWDTLYKVLDAVEGVVGSEDALVAEGWATRAQIKRFTQTANSIAAVGDAARHGKDKYQAPSGPMTIKEASELLSGLLTRLLQWKASCSPSPSSSYDDDATEE